MKHKRNPRLIEMFNEQSGICVYCDEEMTLELGRKDTATIDHIHPRSLGGLKDEYNEVACCSSCNSRKGNLPIPVWLQYLSSRRVHGEQNTDSADSFQTSQQGYHLFGYREGQHPA